MIGWYTQVIKDYKLDWDKSFVSPSSNKKSKSTLEDRATFWKPSSINIQRGSTGVNRKMAASGTALRSKDKSAASKGRANSQASKCKKSNTTKPSTLAECYAASSSAKNSQISGCGTL